jgi:hypothetical protein
MSNSLERLIEAVIATLRVDVIPHISDGYARGQAISVIDLLNNIASRLEWARAPLAETVAEQRNALAAARALLAAPPPGGAGLSEQELASAGATALAVERDRLDCEIADLLAWTQAAEAGGDVKAAVAILLRQVHSAVAREMAMTKKPLFAEIAKGAGERPAREDV